MISIRNLSKYYLVNGEQRLALNNISLDIQAKEIFGIVGRSGAGKSTLIRCVNMLERPSSGQILLEGASLGAMNAPLLREARRHMGMIFQHFNLLQSRNVMDNIALPLELAGFSKLKIRSRVNELLALTELENHRHQTPRQLSGGQKQRVAIARALAISPKVLLCDEATSSLDPQSTRSILELLRSIHQALGITILLITHEMDVVKTLCHRVGILHEGEIIEQSSVIDLFSRPQTQVAKDLVKASSRIEIPRVLKNMLKKTPSPDSGTVICIAYHGDAASRPIIGYLIQQYQINVNILQGNIETIQDQIAGLMIVEIQGTKTNVEKSIAFLERNGLEVEILGYVHRDS